MSLLTLPETDRDLSPYTGWTRAHWLRVADAILDGARRHTSPGGAFVRFPGAPGGYGADVDALEGFARTFMLAAFRIAGDPEGTTELAERYASGFAAGVDPASPERWLRPDEVDQAKVESAALALGLHLTRDQIWARFSDETRTHVVDYLSGFLGAPYPPNNWAWFRILTSQFLASVGAAHRPDDIEADLALLDSFERGGGWSSDGHERAYDHYCGWALPFYPVIWGDMVRGDERWTARLERSRAALDDYLDDALHLIGADGAPLFQGRSLTYRFATAGPAWAAVLGGSSRHDLGLLRRAASGQVAHFARHGAPGDDGVLPIGWHGPWRRMAQRYSGPGSPYWAAKGLLGIALSEDHPVWSATELPLPADEGAFTRVIAAPGWIASADDGVARIANHGTDHRDEGDGYADGPLYARLGYSTATSPALVGDTVADPLDNHIGLLRGGVASHRSGFARGEIVALDASTALAASTARARWPLAFAGDPDHGGGDTVTRSVPGPLVDTVSVVRGAWDVRFVRVRAGEEDLGHDGTVRAGGWPLTGDVADAGEAWIRTARLASRVVALHGSARAGVTCLGDVTPLDGATSVPWIATDAPDGEWIVAAAFLGDPVRAAEPPAASRDAGDAWRITWPDGGATVVDPASAVPTARDL
ncbi:DUF2264 domain-containing protein [Microbacterium karelineae]|uniref:DUF2264 domain-containing protein n=1 Tax=Microbacterium karelineae TaxID=2654283 RepID=UPI0012EABCDD|nr:DUF2264 domain-containing protein [Microbacterium karelineae]